MAVSPPTRAFTGSRFRGVRVGPGWRRPWWRYWRRRLSARHDDERADDRCPGPHGPSAAPIQSWEGGVAFATAANYDEPGLRMDGRLSRRGRPPLRRRGDVATWP